MEKPKERQRRKGKSLDDQGEQTLSTPMTSKANTSKPTATGIQALISRLRGGSAAQEDESLAENESWVTPVAIDIYCVGGTETALHCAVRRKEHALASRLLTAGSDPNLAIYTPEEPPLKQQQQQQTRPPPLDEQLLFRGSTCLAEAARNRDLGMIDLLLRHSARDDEGKALCVAAKASDDLIVSKLLVLRANQDPENDINRKGIAEFVGRGSSLVGKGLAGAASVGTLAYASIFPSTSVMINWHDLAHGCLTAIKEQYLIDASVRLNPKLKLSPKFQFSAVHAITRYIRNKTSVEGYTK